MLQEKPKLPLIVLGLLGLMFLLIGIFAGTIQAKRVLQEAAAIDKLPQLDAQSLENTISGTTVVVTGALEANDGVADVGGLVIYVEEIWKIRYNDSEGSEGWEGNWDFLNVIVPDCTFSITGGTVLINTVQEVVIDRTYHEYKYFVPRVSREVEGIKEGSVRRRGFKDGDLITIIGSKDPTGVIPSRIFGGDRAAMEQYLAYQVAGLRTTGIIFSLVGIGLMIIAGYFNYRLPQVERES